MQPTLQLQIIERKGTKVTNIREQLIFPKNCSKTPEAEFESENPAFHTKYIGRAFSFVEAAIGCDIHSPSKIKISTRGVSGRKYSREGSIDAPTLSEHTTAASLPSFPPPFFLSPRVTRTAATLFAGSIEHRPIHGAEKTRGGRLGDASTEGNMLIRESTTLISLGRSARACITEQLLTPP